ncbi:MAG: substrate-binding periplasmic protein [Marinomonas sp.]
MRLQYSLLVFLMTSVFASSVAFGAYKKNSSICTSLTATGNAEYPPFLWRVSDKSDQYLGANRFLMDELSHRIHIPIILKYVGPWSTSLADVKSGRVDMMAGIFYTNNRARYMDFFSPIMLHTTSVVWQRKDKMFSFHSRDDLKGEWGATVMNHRFSKSFDDFAKKNLNMLSVSNLSNAFRMLMENRVDYVLYEKKPGIAYASILGFDGDIVFLQPAISREGLYLAMSKLSPCNTPVIKHKITAALHDIEEQGLAEKALLQGMKDWRMSQAKMTVLLQKQQRALSILLP